MLEAGPGPSEIEFGGHYGMVQKLTMAPKIVYSLEAKRKLSAIIGDARPDLCHVHNIYHHLSPSVLVAARQARLPVVMTVHDLKIACPAYKMLTQDGVCERCRGGRLRNVIRHRCVKTGVTFTSGSIADLAEALERMARSSVADILDMGRRARALVEAEYSTSRYLERIFGVYRELGVAA